MKHAIDIKIHLKHPSRTLTHAHSHTAHASTCIHMHTAFRNSSSSSCISLPVRGETIHQFALNSRVHTWWSGAQNCMENAQYYVLRLTYVAQNQSHIPEFHPKTWSSSKPLASLANADWANVVDVPASFKSYRDASVNFPKCADYAGLRPHDFSLIKAQPGGHRAPVGLGNHQWASGAKIDCFTSCVGS